MKENKKLNYRNWFLLLGILLFVNFVSANTIGGEVYSEGNAQTNWQNVFVYDINNPNNYVEVKVSPEDNRYSFSDSNKEGKLFLENSVLYAEILDFQNGLMAGPVLMNLSLENNKNYFCIDCDIFPKMKLKEVIQFNESIKQVYISEEGEVNFDLDIYDDCDLSFFSKKDFFENLCENCSNYTFSSIFNFGLNNFNFISDCNKGKRIKGGSKEFVSSSIDFWFKFDKILLFFNEESFSISFSGIKSKEIFSINDFIPNEFEVFNVSHGGQVYIEDGYYRIEWPNRYGSTFNFTYNIKPKEKLKSCEVGLTNDFILIQPFSENVNSFREFENLKENDFYFDCNFSKDVSIWVLEQVDFEKVMDEKIKNKEMKSVEIKGNLSEDVLSVEFKEYVPVEFDILEISNGGRVERSNSKYNVIIWEVNENNFNFNYGIIPRVSGDFYFMSEFGGNQLDERVVKVYGNIVSGGNKKSKVSEYKYEPVNFSIVSNTFPLIDKLDNLTVAIYSKNFTDKGALDLVPFDFNGKVYNRSLNYLGGYLLENNLGNNVDKFSFEFEFDKKYSDLEVYGLDSKGKFFKLHGQVINDGKVLKFFSEGNEFFSQVVMYGVKQDLSLWDRFIEWSWKLFGNKTGII
jgi:hypothetical protein